MQLSSIFVPIVYLHMWLLLVVIMSITLLLLLLLLLPRLLLLLSSPDGERGDGHVAGLPPGRGGRAHRAVAAPPAHARRRHRRARVRAHAGHLQRRPANNMPSKVKSGCSMHARFHVPVEVPVLLLTELVQDLPGVPRRSARLRPPRPIRRPSPSVQGRGRVRRPRRPRRRPRLRAGTRGGRVSVRLREKRR